MAYHHRDLRRALVDAALELISEEQAWDFSLREVARRAGVSHNAPYNHFSERRELLAEVAAVGFRSLERALSLATVGEPDAEKALFLLGSAYLEFANRNPALYRLMFGPILADGHPKRPYVTTEAGAVAKTVLVALLKRGAATSAFSFDPNEAAELEAAHLTIWAALHGLASLVVDRKAETSLPETALPRVVVDLLLNGLLNPMKRKTEDDARSHIRN